MKTNIEQLVNSLINQNRRRRKIFASVISLGLVITMTASLALAREGYSLEVEQDNVTVETVDEPADNAAEETVDETTDETTDNTSDDNTEDNTSEDTSDETADNTGETTDETGETGGESGETEETDENGEEQNNGEEEPGEGSDENTDETLGENGEEPNDGEEEPGEGEEPNDGDEELDGNGEEQTEGEETDENGTEPSEGEEPNGEDKEPSENQDETNTKPAEDETDGLVDVEKPDNAEEGEEGGSDEDYDEEEDNEDGYSGERELISTDSNISQFISDVEIFDESGEEFTTGAPKYGDLYSLQIKFTSPSGNPFSIADGAYVEYQLPAGVTPVYEEYPQTVTEKGEAFEDNSEEETEASDEEKDEEIEVSDEEKEEETENKTEETTAEPSQETEASEETPEKTTESESSEGTEKITKSFEGKVEIEAETPEITTVEPSEEPEGETEPEEPEEESEEEIKEETEEPNEEENPEEIKESEQGEGEQEEETTEEEEKEEDKEEEKENYTGETSVTYTVYEDGLVEFTEMTGVLVTLNIPVIFDDETVKAFDFGNGIFRGESPFALPTPMATGDIYSDLDYFWDMSNPVTIYANGVKVYEKGRFLVPDYVFTEGVEYKFALSFAESGSKYFGYDGDEYLTYKLPPALTVSRNQTVELLVEDPAGSGRMVPCGEYTIDTNGMIKVRFDDLPNGENYIYYYANVAMTLDVTASFKNNGNDVNLGFSDNINIEVVVEPPKGYISIEKEAVKVATPSANSVKYTVTAQAVNADLTNVVITDNLSFPADHEHWISPDMYSGITYYIKDSYDAAPPRNKTPLNISYTTKPLLYQNPSDIGGLEFYLPVTLKEGQVVVLEYTINFDDHIDYVISEGENTGATATDYYVPVDNKATAAGKYTNNGKTEDTNTGLAEDFVDFEKGKGENSGMFGLRKNGRAVSKNGQMYMEYEVKFTIDGEESKGKWIDLLDELFVIMDVPALSGFNSDKKLVHINNQPENMAITAEYNGISRPVTGYTIVGADIGDGYDAGDYGYEHPEEEGDDRGDFIVPYEFMLYFTDRTYVDRNSNWTLEETVDFTMTYDIPFDSEIVILDEDLRLFAQGFAQDTGERESQLLSDLAWYEAYYESNDYIADDSLRPRTLGDLLNYFGPELKTSRLSNGIGLYIEDVGYQYVWHDTPTSPIIKNGTFRDGLLHYTVHSPDASEGKFLGLADSWERGQPAPELTFIDDYEEDKASLIKNSVKITGVWGWEAEKYTFTASIPEDEITDEGGKFSFVIPEDLTVDNFKYIDSVEINGRTLSKGQLQGGAGNPYNILRFFRYRAPSGTEGESVYWHWLYGGESDFTVSYDMTVTANNSGDTTNTAGFQLEDLFISDSAVVPYDNDPVSKTMTNGNNTDIGNVEILLNPGSEKFDTITGLPSYTVDDYMSANLSLLPNSVKIYKRVGYDWEEITNLSGNEDEDGAFWTGTEGDGNNSVHFRVPDETYIKIVYNVLILTEEEGPVQVSNYVYISNELNDEVDTVFEVQDITGGAVAGRTTQKLIKTDETDSNTRLQGAKFALYATQAGEALTDSAIQNLRAQTVSALNGGLPLPMSILLGSENQQFNFITSGVTNGDGVIVFDSPFLTVYRSGFSQSVYALVEYEAPQGYILPEIEFEERAENEDKEQVMDVISGEEYITLFSLIPGGVEFDGKNIISQDIIYATNKPAEQYTPELPNTGGYDMLLYTVTGSTLMTMALFVMNCTRRRKRQYRIQNAE